jgi:Spy/CpxP family protein refolding chaperone
MKPSIAVSLSVLSIGLAFSASARADDPSSPPTPPPPAPTGPADGTAPQRHHHQGYVLADLTEKLGLTADQQKTVGSIIDDGKSQSKGVRSDETLSRDDKRAKMGAIMKATHDQIRAALTPDQQKQFDALAQPGDRPKAPPSN